MIGTRYVIKYHAPTLGAPVFDSISQHAFTYDEGAELTSSFSREDNYYIVKISYPEGKTLASSTSLKSLLEMAVGIVDPDSIVKAPKAVKAAAQKETVIAPKETAKVEEVVSVPVSAPDLPELAPKDIAVDPAKL